MRYPLGIDKSCDHIGQCNCDARLRDGTLMRLIMLALALCISCFGQIGKSAHFDAASIRPVNTVGMNHFFGGPGSSDPGHASYTGISLRDLICAVYTDSRSERVSGPSWLDSKYALTVTYQRNATMDQ